jgi:hypothetical protein
MCPMRPWRPEAEPRPRPGGAARRAVSTVRAPRRSLLAAVLGVILTACGPPFLAPAFAAGPAPDPDDAPAFGTLPLAYESTTLAHFLNPALLGGRSGKGACGWIGYRDRVAESWQTAMRLGGFSLGYRAYFHPPATEVCAARHVGGAAASVDGCEPVHPRREVSVCAGLGEMPLMARGVLGHRLRRAWGEREDAWRWDIGLAWPAAPWLTAGLVARDVAQDRLDGVLLRRTYDVGLVAGPLIRAHGAQVVAAAEALGREDQRWVDEAILRVGVTVAHTSGAQLRVTADSRPGESGGERETVLAVGLTVPFGRSQLLAAATRDRRAGARQPRFGFGFVEEER